MKPFNKLETTNIKYHLGRILTDKLQDAANKEFSKEVNIIHINFNILFREFDELRKLHNNLKFYP